MTVEILIGLISAGLAAILTGKFWGNRKYQKGYTEGRVDQVTDFTRASEANKKIIEAKDEVALIAAEKEAEAALAEAKELMGRRPTQEEFDAFNERAKL